MTQIRVPFVANPIPPRRRRLSQLSDRLAYFAILTVTLAALGCREDAEPPTGPERGPKFETTQAHDLDFREVSAGAAHTCGLSFDPETNTQAMYCWGRNNEGQLGDGTTTDRLSPVPVAGGLDFISVTAGDFHTCGLARTFQVFCWGDNSSGQLGDGTTSNRLTPVAVSGSRRYSTLTAGGRHTCARGPFYTAFCWGANSEGQLGDGTQTRRLTPVRVAGGRQFFHLRAGGSHTCGVTPENRAYCWGSNDAGQLGDGTTADHLTPVAVAGGIAFAMRLAAGDRHTCGIAKQTLRLYCWGSNASGQLGDGTTTRRLTPVAVGGRLRFKTVTAGETHTCGVRGLDDRAYCWGGNSSGQLGDGTTTRRLSPVLVSGELEFYRMSAGRSHTCGIATGTFRLYCWGANTFGQLGDGTTQQRLTPTPVSGAT